jgi:hypothetical protein
MRKLIASTFTSLDGGSDHPDTLSSMNNLARRCTHKGIGPGHTNSGSRWSRPWLGCR